MVDFTWLDWFILAVILLSSLLGAWRGIVSEVLALLAWIAAFFAARIWGGAAAELLSAWLHNLHEPALRQMVGFATVFIATLLLFAVARLLLSSLLRAVGLGLVDRFLGALFGLGRGVLLVLAGMLVAGLTALPSRQWWREAVLVPPLETAVLAAKPWMPPMLEQRIRYHPVHAGRNES